MKNVATGLATHLSDLKYIPASFAFVANLCVHQRAAENVIGAKLVPAIVAALRTHKNETAVLMRGLRALENMAYGSQNIRDHMKTQQVIECCTEIKEKHAAKEDLARQAQATIDAVNKTKADLSGTNFVSMLPVDKKKNARDLFNDSKEVKVVLELEKQHKNLLLGLSLLSVCVPVCFCLSVCLSVCLLVFVLPVLSVLTFLSLLLLRFLSFSPSPSFSFFFSSPAGAMLTKHSKSAAPKTRHVYITQDLKLVAWKDPKKSLDPKQTMKVYKIRSIEIGRATAPLQRKSLFGAYLAKEECCFAIMGRDRSVDLECKSEQERDQWVAAMKHLVAYVKAQKAEGTKFTNNA
jgi:hypothetical protein